MAMTSRRTKAPTGWRLWALRVVLAVFLPLALLLALEGSLAILDFGYPTDFALEVDDTGRYGMNLRFGWRFFPESIARSSLLFSFPADKPPDTYRIFVLGASAAQGYPRGAFSFSRMLEVILEDACPETDFEIVNTSIVATNSHVVLPIARECAGYEPDMFLVYLGNNEVIGPYGLGSSATRTAGSLGAVRAGIALRSTRTGQLIQSAINRLRGDDDLLENWGGMEMFAEQYVTVDDPALDPVYANFAANLRDIRRAASDAGAEIVFSTVAVNVWDGAPFASRHRDGLSDEDLIAWSGALADGLAAFEEGRLSAADEALARAAALDDRHAELAWRRGRLALALGDTSTAESHFKVAKELDVLRFRADERINDVIRETALAPGDRPAYLVDAAAVFAEFGPDLAANSLERRFYEHVHLTFTGHYDLAAAVYPVVARALPESIRRGSVGPPSSRERCAEALLWSDWEAVQTVQMLLTLLNDPPFPERADHAEVTARWRAVVTDLQAGLDRGKLLQLLPAYEARVAADPTDMLTRTLYADLLRAVGENGKARRQWQFIERHQPPMDWKH